MIDKEEYDKLLMKLGELAIRVDSLEKELSINRSIDAYKKNLDGILKLSNAEFIDSKKQRDLNYIEYM